MNCDDLSLVITMIFLSASTQKRTPKHQGVNFCVEADHEINEMTFSRSFHGFHGLPQHKKENPNIRVLYFVSMLTIKSRYNGKGKGHHIDLSDMKKNI